MTADNRDVVERLGESLFALSDKMRASGIMSASDAVHAAYERVVADFAALKASNHAALVAERDALRALLWEAMDDASIEPGPWYNSARAALQLSDTGGEAI